MEKGLLPRALVPAGAAFGATLWLYSCQAVALLIYVICALTLPDRVDWLSDAAHVAALHAMLFFFIALCWGGIRSFDFARVPSYFPLTPRLAEAPSVVVITGNAVLLLCLAVEEWVQREGTHYDFSVLAVVQCLAVGELLIVAATTLAVAWRYVQYLKLPGGDTWGRSEEEGDIFSLQVSGMGGEEWLPTVMPSAGGAATQEVRGVRARRDVERRAKHAFRDATSLASLSRPYPLPPPPSASLN